MSGSSSSNKFNALSCSYIPCTACNAFFAVRVPCSSMSQEAFTIQCSKCNHVCSVIPNLHPAKLGHDDLQVASKSTKAFGNQAATESIASENRVVNKPPSKRQRAPSLYNQFIKEEIQRIKLKNPDTPHREAFSAAAKNWARFPDLHFGLMLKTTAADQPNKIQKEGGEHLKQLLK